jgi:transposase-like protein
MARGKERTKKTDELVLPVAVDAVPGRAFIKVTAPCPKCGGYYTARTGEAGAVQYRVCKACGKTFKVDMVPRENS